jgi:hypothetical protein
MPLNKEGSSEPFVSLERERTTEIFLLTSLTPGDPIIPANADTPACAWGQHNGTCIPTGHTFYPFLAHP